MCKAPEVGTGVTLAPARHQPKIASPSSWGGASKWADARAELRRRRAEDAAWDVAATASVVIASHRTNVSVGGPKWCRSSSG
jgi:hypothetical protein